MTNLARSEKAQILARVRAALSDHERWPRQLEAEAIAQALVIDMQEANAAPGDETSIPDDRIVQAARDLVAALDNKPAPFTLPFGTRVTLGRPGSVEIAGRVYVARPHVPGLHPIETTPRDAHGSNMESLRLCVFNWGGSSSCRNFGLPTPASVALGGVRHVIEFPPLAELGGAVLQYDVDTIDAARFCSAPNRSLEKFCKIVVRDTQRLWRHRVKIARRVEQVRRAAEEGIGLADHYGGRADLGRILIDPRSSWLGNVPTLRIEYLGNDDALRRGTLHEVVDSHDPAAAQSMMRAALVHRQRGRKLDDLRQFGADGRIDASAAAVARAAPEGAAAILLRLSRELETLVTVPSPGGVRHATLFWRDGVIRAEELTGDGLARLWQVSDQPSAMVRDDAARSQTSMTPFLDLAPRAEGFLTDGHRMPAPADGPWLVNTEIGEIWPEPVDVPT